MVAISLSWRQVSTENKSVACFKAPYYIPQASFAISNGKPAQNSFPVVRAGKLNKNQDRVVPRACQPAVYTFGKP